MSRRQGAHRAFSRGLVAVTAALGLAVASAAMRPSQGAVSVLVYHRLGPASDGMTVRTSTFRRQQPRGVFKQRLGIEVDEIAWPFGIYDDELIALARESGYVAGFSIERRLVRAGDSIMALPRFLVTDGTVGKRFASILPSESP